jgi:hypothetical protein
VLVLLAGVILASVFDVGEYLLEYSGVFIILEDLWILCFELLALAGGGEGGIGD